MHYNCYMLILGGFGVKILQLSPGMRNFVPNSKLSRTTGKIAVTEQRSEILPKAVDWVLVD